MKRYDHGGGWSTEAAHGKWVLYEDSRELVAALQVAHEMEVKNLKSDIDALKAELAALKAPPKGLSAEEVVEPGIYIVRDIDRGNMLSARHIDCVDIDIGVNLGYEYIGPLRLPEEV